VRRRTVAGLATIALVLLAVLAFFALRGWPGATPQLDGLTPMRGDLLCGTVDYSDAAADVPSPAVGALIRVGFSPPGTYQGYTVNAEQCFAAAAAKCRAAALEAHEFVVDYGQTELVEVEPGAHCSIDYRWIASSAESLPGTGTYFYGKCASAAYTSTAGLTLTGCDSGYIAISNFLPASPTPGSG